MSKEEIVFVNPTDSENEKGGKAEECDCRLRFSDGYGNYSDVYFITLCKKHKEQK